MPQASPERSLDPELVVARRHKVDPCRRNKREPRLCQPLVDERHTLWSFEADESVAHDHEPEVVAAVVALMGELHVRG